MVTQAPGCISFDSYIKPQPYSIYGSVGTRCISFDSYIKPQQRCGRKHLSGVVYLLIPTSNHNCHTLIFFFDGLYIFWFLHQTTTLKASGRIVLGCISFDSYIKPQLTVVLRCCTLCCISFDSYIKPQRQRRVWKSSLRCISFDSYIKPQLVLHQVLLLWVVYLLIPTSNHNYEIANTGYIMLYIFWFLHQTTTYFQNTITYISCISFDSYIKPQQFSW